MFIISVVRLQLSSNLNNVYIKHPVSLEQYIMEGSCAEAGRMLNLSGSEMTEFARKRDWKVTGERTSITVNLTISPLSVKSNWTSAK